MRPRDARDGCKPETPNAKGANMLLYDVFYTGGGFDRAVPLQSAAKGKAVAKCVNGPAEYLKCDGPKGEWKPSNVTEFMALIDRRHCKIG
jgi:hypothetical protein